MVPEACLPVLATMDSELDGFISFQLGPTVGNCCNKSSERTLTLATNCNAISVITNTKGTDKRAA